MAHEHRSRRHRVTFASDTGAQRQRRVRASAWLFVAACGGVVAASGLSRLFTGSDPAAASRTAATGIAPSPAPEAAAVAPSERAAGVSFTSRDGSVRFRVPAPGEPEYADYQEMLHHPRFRSALEGLPGYALPYDPEWRSVLDGRRAVGPIAAELEGGAASLAGLARAYLGTIAARDDIGMLKLRISRNEFEHILWPEFPQSRPYLRIQPEDAWILHHSTSMSGVQAVLEALGGRQLQLLEVTHGDVVRYTNFTMFRDVVIRVRDPQTQTVVTLPYMQTVVSRHGRFKAYIYEG